MFLTLKDYFNKYTISTKTTDNLNYENTNNKYTIKKK